MTTGVARALRACKRLIDHESAEFLTARWNAKDARAMETFPEQIYRDRLAAMERAHRTIREGAETLGGPDEAVEGFLRATREAIPETPENIYFVSELRRKLGNLIRA